MTMFATRAPRVLSAWIAALGMAMPALGAPLSLDEAIRIAETRSPQLGAQRAAAEAAAALVPAAGELPDPRLIVGLENVPTDGADKWSLNADFMTMRKVGVMQDFVRGEKRELRETKAAAESKRELALVEMQRADLRREVATAWFERLYAERTRALVEALTREAELQSSTSAASIAGGKVSTAEGVAARALVASLSERRLDSERQARRAAAMLGRWLGEDAARALGEAPDIGAAMHHGGALEADLERHPHLAMYAPMEAAAEADMRLAAAATKPDWSVELTYAQRGSAYSNMVSLMVRMDLPIFAASRQDPAAASKAKQLEQVRAQADDARRRHVAEIRAGIVDWDIARERLARHRSELVPLAEERAKAALSAYEGGRGDLAMVLEARRGVIEARLAALAAEAEVARSWAQLAYLLPEGKTP